VTFLVYTIFDDRGDPVVKSNLVHLDIIEDWTNCLAYQGPTSSWWLLRTPVIITTLVA